MKYPCALVEALGPVAAWPPADQRIWLIFQHFLVLLWAVLVVLRNAKWSDKNVRLLFSLISVLAYLKKCFKY